MDNGASSYRRFRDDGDENGLREIIQDYRDGLILYLNSFTGNIQTAEEIAEDTFVLLGTKRPRDKGKGSFRTWLYTIGRNLAINHLRRNARKREVSYEDYPDFSCDVDALEHTYIQEESKIALHKAMQKLKPEYRQILWLIYFEDFSIKAAAAVMKRSAHSTETLVYRARKSLRSQLEMEGFIYENL